MKHDYLPAWLQWTLLVSLVAIILLMPLHAFVSTWGGTAIGPLWLWKSWKEILLAILMISMIGWLSMKPHRWAVLGRDKLFWLILGFVGLLLVSALYHARANGSEALAAGLAMDSRYLLIFGLSYMLLRFGTLPWLEWRHITSRFLIITGVILAVMAIVQVVLLPADFLTQFGYDKQETIAPYVLIDENPDALRAFATMRGPNDLGAYLLIPLALSLALIKIGKRWSLAVATLLAGIFLTGSRSAWIGIFIVIAITSAMVWGKSLLHSRRFMIGVIASVAVIVVVGLSALSIPAVRLAVFHSSPGDSSLTEGSTDKHWEATAAGLARVAANPLGCGAGCAGPASYYSATPKISENYYVQIAEEVGAIGLVLWAAITGTVTWRLWGARTDRLARGLLASFIAISAIGLWLHVWSDDPLSLTWWALAGAVLGYHASASAKKSVS